MSSAADRTIVECAHCGRTFVATSGPGRPAKYCRRSCRQRAFEQRRHIGDLAWADSRLVRMAGEMAEREDRIDRLRDILDELRADLADGRTVDAEQLVERIDDALGPVWANLT